MVHLNDRHKVKMGKATVSYFKGFSYMMERREAGGAGEAELARRVQQ